MALNEFLEHVNQKFCNLHIDQETVEHINRATIQIVQHVMDEIGLRKPRLNIKEIISVGSFVEGTKNRSPNEFDFMVCFDFLSKKDNIRIESTEGCQPGYMVVFLNCADVFDGVDIIRKLYADVCCIHHVGLRAEFIKVLDEVVTPLSMMKILTPQGILVIKSSEILSLKLEWHKFEDQYKESDIYSGLCDRDIHLETSYSLDIDVDIMPAITVEDFSLLSDVHGFPTHIIEIIENRKFHLICKESGQEPHAPYLQISHATTEVFLVSRLHPIHKQCYKLLKYLLTDGTNINRTIKDINLSSYVYKNAILFHEYDKLCSRTPDTVKCCIEILNYIRDKLREGVFPSFLRRTTNVWGQCYKYPSHFGWRPTDLDKDICSFDWGLVLWFQLWRQFLGKALTIFQRIEMQLSTSEPASHGSNIPPDDLVSNSFVIAEYVPNKYDPFLEEFTILRKDILSITTEYSKLAAETATIRSKPPSESVWELVLPKFPEYLSRIERVCRRKVSIPKENFKEVEILGSIIKTSAHPMI